MALNKGDIVLVEFPFTDLSQTKLRPEIVLSVSTRFDEITLCFVSSQAVDALELNEFALNTTDPEFAETGLRVTSRVRVTRITTLNSLLIKRRLGKLGSRYTQALNEYLLQAFRLQRPDEE
ncbi:MAG: type II toxin-antitoxin system PemK/MazF family toxin [Lyngbya sp. HA4199-MV5]|jgi:mRNA interferase MazF|nr:type II toxin-antitoxin system PemK/MazF family toxin [Lyngbya sp. HA4199-MV5]